MANTKNPGVLWNVEQGLEKEGKELARANLGLGNITTPGTSGTFLKGITENAETGELSFIYDNPVTQDVRDYADKRSVHLFTCSTSAGTQTKALTLVEGPGNYVEADGVLIYVKFDNTNTATSPKLQAPGKSAVPIYVDSGTTAPGTTESTSWKAGKYVGFVYHSGAYRMLYSETTGVSLTEIGSTAINLDTLTASDGKVQYYYWSTTNKANVTGKPFDGAGSLMVMPSGSGSPGTYVTQVCYRRGTNDICIRRRSDGSTSWGDWQTVAYTDGTYSSMSVGSATRSDNLYVQRVTTGDLNDYTSDHDGRILEVDGANVAHSPSSSWYHVYSTRGTDAAYAVQIAVGMTVDELWTRRKIANSGWQAWVKYQAALPYDSSTAKFGINISGTADAAGMAGYTPVLLNTAGTAGSDGYVLLQGDVIGGTPTLLLTKQTGSGRTITQVSSDGIQMDGSLVVGTSINVANKLLVTSSGTDVSGSLAVSGETVVNGNLSWASTGSSPHGSGFGGNEVYYCLVGYLSDDTRGYGIGSIYSGITLSVEITHDKANAVTQSGILWIGGGYYEHTGTADIYAEYCSLSRRQESFIYNSSVDSQPEINLYVRKGDGNKIEVYARLRRYSAIYINPLNTAGRKFIRTEWTDAVSLPGDAREVTWSHLLRKSRGSTGTGTINTPIYIDSDGVIQECVISGGQSDSAKSVGNQVPGYGGGYRTVQLNALSNSVWGLTLAKSSDTAMSNCSEKLFLTSGNMLLVNNSGNTHYEINLGTHSVGGNSINELRLSSSGNGGSRAAALSAAKLNITDGTSSVNVGYDGNRMSITGPIYYANDNTVGIPFYGTALNAAGVLDLDGNVWKIKKVTSFGSLTPASDTIYFI